MHTKTLCVCVYVCSCRCYVFVRVLAASVVHVAGDVHASICARGRRWRRWRQRRRRDRRAVELLCGIQLSLMMFLVVFYWRTMLLPLYSSVSMCVSMCVACLFYSPLATAVAFAGPGGDAVSRWCSLAQRSHKDIELQHANVLRHLCSTILYYSVRVVRVGL